MTFCGTCGTKVDEGIKFCPGCGTAIEMNEPEQTQPQHAASEQEQPAANQNDFSAKLAALNNTADTTADFDKTDIEQNKVMAVLAYIIFLVPLIAAKDSRFARFHTNQGLVLFISVIIFSIVAAIPIIGWIIAPIIGLLITVLAIIGIINALNGRTKELPIIGKFKILK